MTADRERWAGGFEEASRLDAEQCQPTRQEKPMHSPLTGGRKRRRRPVHPLERALIVAVVLSAVITLALTLAANADAHVWAGCKTDRCKRHVVAPYQPLMRSIAYCETGGTMNPRIHNPSGIYHGLLQFDERSWRGAGGWGDPHNASVLEQYYRGVLWLHINGRSSWPNC